MRIWHPISCEELDRQGLLGEHVELHVLWNTLCRRSNAPPSRAWINHPETKRWIGRLGALFLRHNEQVEVMKLRGYKHNSNLNIEEISGESFEFPDALEPLHILKWRLSEKLYLRSLQKEK